MNKAPRPIDEELLIKCLTAVPPSPPRPPDAIRRANPWYANAPDRFAAGGGLLFILKQLAPLALVGSIVLLIIIGVWGVDPAPSGRDNAVLGQTAMPSLSSETTPQPPGDLTPTALLDGAPIPTAVGCPSRMTSYGLPAGPWPGLSTPDPAPYPTLMEECPTSMPTDEPEPTDEPK